MEYRSMRNKVIKTLAGSGLLLLGMTVRAQNPPQPWSPQAQEQRDADDQSRIFDHARSDLDRVHEEATPFSPDRDRIMVAMQLLNRCQREVIGGNYDRHTFDQTIASIQRVMDLNRLTEQSRGYLGDDVRAMSRLQARLEGY